MTNYSVVLSAIRPGAKWSLLGNEFSNINWLDDSPKPTKKTLDDAWQGVKYDLDYKQVQEERRARYQAETDGMYMAAVREDKPLDDWKAACSEIKADLPYPKEPK